jgi:hypothetical protein
MFLIVDHFEPAKVDAELSSEKVRNWCERYETITRGHMDSDGIYPQHTWFYRYDFPHIENIRILSEYVFKKFGEIEFHLHHYNDNEENFRKTIREGVEWFNQTGAMLSAENLPQKSFAYIAGNWALDNGQRNASVSGVNTEISILSGLGCYADFTFPAFGEVSQPHMVNTIYYATDTPEPKSYDCGLEIEVGKAANGDLMIFQGPLYIDWKNIFTETAAFESFTRYFSRRIDYWTNAHVHVKGKPEWLFIKLHTHGMQSHEMFLSNELHQLCSDLENRFKAVPFRLHYVSAREAFNIAKAAEAGLNGNPGAYRDYLIKPPVNKKICCNKSYSLRSYSKNRIAFQIENSSTETIVLLDESPVKSIKGNQIEDIELSFKENELIDVHIRGEETCHIEFRENNVIRKLGRNKTALLPYKFHL